jgi:hypothetical protein
LLPGQLKTAYEVAMSKKKIMESKNAATDDQKQIVKVTDENLRSQTVPDVLNRIPEGVLYALHWHLITHYVNGT